MAWTDPAEWNVGDVLTKDRLNQDIRDNLIALKTPPSANFEADEASNYTTTSTVFVDVDATEGKFQLTIETAGGDVMVGFVGTCEIITNNRLYFDIDVDGTRKAGDDGICFQEWNSADSADEDTVISFVYLVTGLTPGSHTFKLQWRVNGGTGILFAGATNNKAVHPQFWVREVS
jgi:hypothetical protein